MAHPKPEKPRDPQTGGDANRHFQNCALNAESSRGAAPRLEGFRSFSSGARLWLSGAFTEFVGLRAYLGVMGFRLFALGALHLEKGWGGQGRGGWGKVPKPKTRKPRLCVGIMLAKSSAAPHTIP